MTPATQTPPEPHEGAPDGSEPLLPEPVEVEPVAADPPRLERRPWVRPAPPQGAPQDGGEAQPDADGPAQRAWVRDLFLRLLGGVGLIAFGSLAVQLPVLVGPEGILPAGTLLSTATDQLPGWAARLHRLPTVLWFVGTSDGALMFTAALGLLCNLLLVLGRLPGPALLLSWFLYLQLVTVGSPFLSFQWDNLFLEASFCALLVVPWGWRLAGSPAPSRAGVWLMLWLVIRLHVESGASKLLSGDPSWRDLTAMVRYYETIPLPTPLAWYAHQLPRGVHVATALVTFVAELAVPLLVFFGRRARLVAFWVLVGLQATIAATGNYGFFNLLSAVLCLFLLDDDHLRAAARRVGRTLAPRPAPRPGLLAALRGSLALAFGALAVLPFLPWMTSMPGVGPAAQRTLQAAAPIQAAIAPLRTFNAYHLFASMTNVRDEVVIQGTRDGETWETYELAYQAGDVLRAPPFVAPHQPRVDFQLWFLLLPGEVAAEPDAMYFNRRLQARGRAWFSALLRRIQLEPESVAALFVGEPFANGPPVALRLQAWRYGFTDAKTRSDTGAWWQRELRHQSGPIDLR